MYISQQATKVWASRHHLRPHACWQTSYWEDRPKSIAPLTCRIGPTLLMPETVRIVINGSDLSIEPGCTVAAAVLRSGRSKFRTSVTGQPGAALCGMGICFECRVTIDGRRDCRSCLVPV